MNTKTMRVGLFLILALALTSTAAFAWRGGCPGYGGGYGGGYGCQGRGGQGPGAALTPEKQEAYQKLYQEYAEKAAPLRAQLAAKQAELEVLETDAKADSGKIAALAKDIGDLHGKLVEAQAAFQAKAAKEIGPLAAGPGGCPGYGRGAGSGGCPGGGRGPGGCPYAN